MTTCSLEKLEMERISKSLIPWIVVLMAEVVVLWLFPGLVTFVPNHIL